MDGANGFFPHADNFYTHIHIEFLKLKMEEKTYQSSDGCFLLLVYRCVHNVVDVLVLLDIIPVNAPTYICCKCIYSVCDDDDRKNFISKIFQNILKFSKHI